MTGISWTDVTWNPVRGCSRVSEGCRNCYAEQQAARIVRMDRGNAITEGNGKYDGLVKLVAGEPRWTGKVAFDPRKLAEPLRWKRPRRIFVNSMSDLFHESLTNEQIAAVFGVMATCRHHTFQILTKRAKRMREWFAWLFEHSRERPREHCSREAAGTVQEQHGFSSGSEWPLPNAWMGVSVENCDALGRLDDLRATPAAVRFVSAEPLLEDLGAVDLTDVDWLIAGCESGPGARHCSAGWLRSLRDQCAAAGVPYFLKQAVHSPVTYGTGGIRLASLEEVTAGAGSKRKPGGVIELPYLDGVQHAEFPK